MKFTLLATILACVLCTGCFLAVPIASGDITDCQPGYEFQPSSGVGCVQINCATVPDAHYSYTSQCICGSAGSIHEDPADPNKGCYYGNENTSCPGCLYACVHAGEDCPGDTPTTPTNANGSVSTNATVNVNVTTNINQSTNTNPVNVQVDTAASPSLSTSGAVGSSCEIFCNKYVRKYKNAELLTSSGEPPQCQCVVDIRDEQNRLTDTLNVNGDDETTFTFDPSSGALIKRTTFNRKEEAERIRQRLGYRYTEAEIDALLADDKITKWFTAEMDKVDTSTSIKDPQFWWQHVLAILDHGFSGNSADFVDTYRFGRCGDSMEWLERNFLAGTDIGKDPETPGHKHEMILSITGEKYGNLVNHTAIMVRPTGISNLEWEDLVQTLKAKSGGSKDNPGIANADLDDIDPRLLDAKVLDPYFQKQTTVRDFIKGWSYIRIS